MLSFLDDFTPPQPDDPEERDQAARSLTEKCGYAAAALTILPIPGSEIVAVMPIHVGMVVGIGHIYGEDVTRDSAMEMILRIGATVGLSLVGSRLATTAAKILLPGLGGLISAPFMYASTLAIGAVARAYFEKGGDLSKSEMKSVYQSTLKRARKDFDPKKMRSDDAKNLAKEAASKAKDIEPEVAAKAEEVAGADELEKDPVARLEQLKSLLDKGLIEPEEYEEVKNRILSEL